MSTPGVSSGPLPIQIVAGMRTPTTSTMRISQSVALFLWYFDSRADVLKFPTLYPEYYQITASVPQSQTSNLQKAPLYSTGCQSQYNNHNTTSNTHSMHQGQARNLNCVEKRSPMLANGYSHGYIGQRHGSFAEFSNTRQGLKQIAYHNPNESDLASFAAAAPSSYQEDVTIIGDFGIGASSPSTTYSGYSTSSATVDPISLIQVNATAHQNAPTKGAWWLESARNGHSQYHDDVYGLSMLHDGLPRTQKQQQHQYTDLWVPENGFPSTWPTQTTTTATATVPITISPKALTLSVPAPSLSSSASSQDPIIPLSDSSSTSDSSVSSSRQATPESVPETMQVVEPPELNRQHCQILSDSLPRARATPVLPSNDFTTRQTTQKRSVKSRSEIHSVRKPVPPPAQTKLRLFINQSKVDATPETSLPTEEIESTPSAGSPTGQAEHHRSAKDDYLVKQKLAGMSYKDIRRHGNFFEAESTLRGRFRTLTKHKMARVRKPEWTDNDVSILPSSFRLVTDLSKVRLLKKAVRKLTTGSDIAKGKIPWKLVAEYIANNSGSYHFGNATCRKRWDDLPSKQKS